MAKAYGTLDSKNNRSTATKTGGKAGIKSSVQSYEGSVITDLSFDKDDNPIIKIGVARGSSSYYDELLFEGTIDELKNKLVS